MKQVASLVWKWIKRLLITFFVLSVFTTILYRWLPVPVTPLMIIRCWEQIEANEKIKMEYNWVRLDSISENLPLAVITSEDQKFEDHFGLDFEAIEKAQAYNKKMKGEKIKGASTITQQTAKNVFLTPNRSYVRKALEVYFTFLIEIFWSKERIMEIYLNVIEMGPGIYGADAAAHYYFKKPASKLTKRESAAIAAILPNPLKWSASKPTPYINRKISWIMKRMKKMDIKSF